MSIIQSIGQIINIIVGYVLHNKRIGSCISSSWYHLVLPMFIGSLASLSDVPIESQTDITLSENGKQTNV